MYVYLLGHIEGNCPIEEDSGGECIYYISIYNVTSLEYFYLVIAGRVQEYIEVLKFQVLCEVVTLVYYKSFPM